MLGILFKWLIVLLFVFEWDVYAYGTVRYGGYILQQGRDYLLFYECRRGRERESQEGRGEERSQTR
jgi:hypothetical protein